MGRHARSSTKTRVQKLKKRAGLRVFRERETERNGEPSVLPRHKHRRRGRRKDSDRAVQGCGSQNRREFQGSLYWRKRHWSSHRCSSPLQGQTSPPSFSFFFKPLALFLYSVTPQFKQQRVVSVCDMNGCMDTFIWGCNGVLSAFSCYNFSKISRVTEYPSPCRCIVDEYHAFLCYQNFQFQIPIYLLFFIFFKHHYLWYL